METLNSDDCAGGAVGHIGCENCHDWPLCGPAGPTEIPCGWLYGMLLGPAVIGIFLCPDVAAWGWLETGRDGLGLEGLGPAAVDIEVLMGCTEGLGCLDGAGGLTTGFCCIWLNCAAISSALFIISLSRSAVWAALWACAC